MNLLEAVDGALGGVEIRHAQSIAENAMFSTVYAGKWTSERCKMS
jgi:hypothetical protein